RCERENVAHGAVRRAITAENLWQRDGGFAGEAFAKRGGKIGHGWEIEGALGVQRVINLRAAVRWLAKRLQECAQFLGRLAEQIHVVLGAVRSHLAFNHNTLARRAFSAAELGYWYSLNLRGRIVVPAAVISGGKNESVY